MVEKKAVIYARDVANPDTEGEETLYLLDKWGQFDEALQVEADVNLGQNFLKDVTKMY